MAATRMRRIRRSRPCSAIRSETKPSSHANARKKKRPNTVRTSAPFAPGSCSQPNPGLPPPRTQRGAAVAQAAATVAMTPGARRPRCAGANLPAEAATRNTIPQRPASSGASHAFVRACAAAAKPRITPDAIREISLAGGSEFTRTK